MSILLMDFQQQFALSEANVTALRGPRRTGKTLALVYQTVVRAQAVPGLYFYVYNEGNSVRAGREDMNLFETLLDATRTRWRMADASDYYLSNGSVIHFRGKIHQKRYRYSIDLASVDGVSVDEIQNLTTLGYEAVHALFSERCWFSFTCRDVAVDGLDGVKKKPAPWLTDMLADPKTLVLESRSLGRQGFLPNGWKEHVEIIAARAGVVSLPWLREVP